MSDTVIQVDNVGKKYIVTHQHQNQHPTLKDAVADRLRAVLRSIRSPEAARASAVREEFWALKDVSLRVQRGERLGIIGRNGAGKSTLLKILSRITEPTSGRVRIKGRVASLLEVGTGFHPELTGRENIYLNGAVLGMKRAEIRQKFDEIVAFAEIEKFLDTPVKRYSSGMYVRLAFAVAAHLEPEILIVDEVLSVGDMAFQRKCLGKMEDVATQRGRTVLFVSHNLSAVQSLCKRAVWLDSGRVVEEGNAYSVTQHYYQAASPHDDTPLLLREDRTGDGSVRFSGVSIQSLDPDGVIRPQSRLKIVMSYESEQPVRQAHFLVSVYDFQSSQGIYLLSSDTVGGLPEVLPPKGAIACVTDQINLTPGRCFINLRIKKGEAVADYIQFAKFFDVVEDDIYGTGKYPPRDWVTAIINQEWKFVPNDEAHDTF
jgi:lipopolysaccharide transport system ATP-binding protein